MARKWRRGAYLVTTDKARLDLEMVYGFLKTSYWAAGISADVVMRSVKNSLAFGLFRGDEQVGFARVVTDYATFAYLADVFVLEPHRGQGLGRWMMEVGVLAPRTAGLEAMDAGNPGCARTVPQMRFCRPGGPSDLHGEVLTLRVIERSTILHATLIITLRAPLVNRCSQLRGPGRAGRRACRRRIRCSTAKVQEDWYGRPPKRGR
jgi:GNAT superfamily N-acetyltransferase